MKTVRGKIDCGFPGMLCIYESAEALCQCSVSWKCFGAGIGIGRLPPTVAMSWDRDRQCGCKPPVQHISAGYCCFRWISATERFSRRARCESGEADHHVLSCVFVCEEYAESLL